MTVVAAIQMCSSINVKENLKTAKRLIAIAARNRAKLVVLPEMFVMIGGDKVAIKECHGNGVIQDFLKEQARVNDIWVVAGAIPLSCDNPQKTRASTLIFNNRGIEVGRYDKANLFNARIRNKGKIETYNESETTEAGEDDLVISTPFGKVGVAVCFDLRFPLHFLRLVEKGAEIIVVPSAFTYPTGKAHWEVLMRCRAIESFCYFIGACQSGYHEGNRKTYGHSLVIDPWGEILATAAEETEHIIYANIDLKKLTSIRHTFCVKQSLN